jgi:hypothetical protein
LLKSIFHYEVVHAQIRHALRSMPHQVVSYEDLVTAPQKTLQRVLTPLGLDFDRRQLKWAEQEKHIFAGNHIRMHTSSELVLDERWRQRLSPKQLSLIRFGTILSRSSGRNG